MRVSISLDDGIGERLEAAAASEKRSVSSFVALLIEREFAEQTAIESVRVAASAAAEIAGPERVLEALRELKAGAYVTAAAAGGGE
jgi:hypothetical protein